mmetsp:Transcript_17207/g.43228  ORF Transcript_17207/g.43228 Transcript_17207/m.43228 type:complete len:263 (+) Transcript_17207:214-1002(+)
MWPMNSSWRHCFCSTRTSTPPSHPSRSLRSRETARCPPRRSSTPWLKMRGRPPSHFLKPCSQRTCRRDGRSQTYSRSSRTPSALPARRPPCSSRTPRGRRNSARPSATQTPPPVRCCRQQLAGICMGRCRCWHACHHARSTRCTHPRESSSPPSSSRRVSKSARRLGLRPPGCGRWPLACSANTLSPRLEFSVRASDDTACHLRWRAVRSMRWALTFGRTVRASRGKHVPPLFINAAAQDLHPATIGVRQIKQDASLIQQAT